MKPDSCVTWIMPVRNGMPWLPATLSSIEQQTFREQKMLVWENGSNDGTLEELLRWIPRRIPGRVVANEPLPLGASLARAVEAADTELCARIDADDICHPERLEKQVAFMNAHPAVALCGSNVEFIDEFDKVSAAPESYLIHDRDIRWQIRWTNPIAHPTVIFRRRIILQAGNYRDLQPYEDYDMWFRVAALGEMANLSDTLLRYRKHSKSVTATADPDYFRYYRAVAELNASRLFAGLGPEDALRLREQAHRDTPVPVHLRDIHLYSRAAASTALALGKPRDYFLNSEAFRRLRKELFRNLVIQRPVGRSFIALKRSLKG